MIVQNLALQRGQWLSFSGVQSGGANGAPAPGIQGRGASKEGNYKI